MSTGSFTPRETVSELDRYIVGQAKAKRAVAIALRNRWRRQQVGDELRDEISPKNIIMIGPTGCGKTEIARRLAKLAKAPFVKVEASKFTEVGYVGRDVEGMVRDLVENAIDLVQREQMEHVKVKAKELTEDRLVALIADQDAPLEHPEDVAQQKPAGGFFGFVAPQKQQRAPHSKERLQEIRDQLRAGELEDELIEISVPDGSSPFMTIFGQNGTEEMNLKDMLSHVPGFQAKNKKTKMAVKDARKIVEKQEAASLIDQERLKRDAITRTEQSGIVFLDEIDKVASRQRSGGGGPDVSREGVQRDLLPIVEGTTVSTKHGPVKTDHILFIAAGAFHVAEVSDLIPELQGRFPIRVELDALGKDEFVKILTEPRNALTRQYEALMATEGITLSFDTSAIDAIADYAAEANGRAQNIGARRLATVLEALLEELSYQASELPSGDKVIDGAYVKKTLDPIVNDKDLSKYIL